MSAKKWRPRRDFTERVLLPPRAINQGEADPTNGRAESGAWNVVSGEGDSELIREGIEGRKWIGY
ncbi:hypothetical protein N7462_000320 [Penicillium macrosclerotiorum]|uniref:uncharacterized protein n=1 Tax=Penicillium macrosclerotiorum TaxID=303699 RepID=UPI002546D866|nr:uncharacterized protein N7462_000320 [Penicillium macrosclerotiorum]KAJ5698315.1 hypothetical protein N7462_000320 [Penicillium macrosclerotiorum]